MPGSRRVPDTYFRPDPRERRDTTFRKTPVQPKRVETNAHGSRTYYYDCENCGIEFGFHRRKRYAHAYCGDKCRIDALAKSHLGKKRSPEVIERISIGQRRTWMKKDVREKRIQGMAGKNSRPAWNKGKYKTYTYTCDGCGIVFTTRVRRFGTKKFHSSECRDQWQGTTGRTGQWQKCLQPDCNRMVYVKKHDLEEGTRRFCSQKCAKSDPTYRAGLSERIMGEKHPLWRGWEWSGWDEWRTDRKDWDPVARRIRKMDDYECQSCGKKQSRKDRTFLVHHIIPLKLGGPDEDWNLITLCESCHKRIELRAGPIRYPSEFQELRGRFLFSTAKVQVCTGPWNHAPKSPTLSDSPTSQNTGQ
jgi:5-methylcytosine-specific restriction endonuclease McrA